MAYNIVYKDSVKRDQKRLDKSEASRVLDQLERDLSVKPDAYPALKGELVGLRKYHEGDYLFIVAILNENVLALRISHRKDVYKCNIMKCRYVNPWWLAISLLEESYMVHVGASLNSDTGPRRLKYD